MTAKQNQKPEWHELYNWSHKHLFIDLSLLYNCTPKIYKVGTYTDEKYIYLLFNWLYDKDDNSQRVSIDTAIYNIDKYIIKIPYGEWWNEWKYESQVYLDKYDSWVKKTITDPVHRRIIEGTKYIDPSKSV